MSNKRVVWTNPDGSVSVLVPAPGVDEAVWRQAVPTDVAAVETTADKLPQDRLFRAAWKASADGCTECPVKAKEAAHALRRARRAEAFAPHDEVIAKAIPGKAAEAEQARQKVREADAVLQATLDACTTPAELRRALGA